MVKALQDGARLELLGFEAWVVGRRRTLEALHRRGLVDSYQVTPRSVTLYYLLNDAGRVQIGWLEPSQVA